MTMKLAAAVAFVALCSSVCAKEELVRRRELFDGLEWQGGRSDASFLRSPEWGKSKHGKATKAKGMKGMKGMKYGMHGMKNPPYKPPKQPKPPVYAPTQKSCELDTCTLPPTDGMKLVDDCKLHTTCAQACVPTFCKLPENKHKIHGWGGPQDDRYVKLGSICGYFDYVEGYSLHRHDIEVCCVVAPNLLPVDDDHATCIGCGDCIYPQKVNDACCKIALGVEASGRDGDYSDRCEFGCCKCGPGNGEDAYACLPFEGADCAESLCPDATSPTTDTTEGTDASTQVSTGPSTGTEPSTTGATDASTTAGSTVTDASTTGATDPSTAGSTVTGTDASSTAATTPQVTDASTAATTPQGTDASTQVTDASTAATTPQGTDASTQVTDPSTVATTPQVTDEATQTTQNDFSGSPGNQPGLQPSCFVDSSDFSICVDLVPNGTGFESWMTDVLSARDVWENVIIAPLPVLPIEGGSSLPLDIAPQCSGVGAVPNTVMSDIYVCVHTVGSSDGRFAFAGPYVYRQNANGGRGFPLQSRIGINSGFLNIDLEPTFIHEFAHALDLFFGPVRLGLTNDSGYAKTTLSGATTNAYAKWQDICGSTTGEIPMQGDFGHWDENCLKDEVMTPRLDFFNEVPVPTPLSAMTIGAMEDIGYTVNYGAADTFGLNDLDNCNDKCVRQCANLQRGSSCPAGSATEGEGEVALPAEVEMAYKAMFRDDLMFFHDQLMKDGYFDKTEPSYVASERIDVLIVDDVGHHHTMTVTYDDVKDM